MKSIFKNNTCLTMDMYREGIIANYKSSHKLLRAMSFAYAIILFIIAYAFFLFMDWTLGSVFLVLGIAIILWNLAGYKLGTKSSFLKFAELHGSHYQVDMEYRFYEERLEQETTKTELAVPYSDFDLVYEMEKILIFTFQKKVIIMDKSAFVDCNCEDVIKFIQNKNIKVKKIS
ncbi:MAG: YcxB family protein [Lachnospiraceae bacterium]|nr:YcxB family protein [Lachnospiraceae bacterium]